MWGDLDDAKYREERGHLSRELRELNATQGAPIEIMDVMRAAALLQDPGALWAHPGVSDETRKAFIEEVFDAIELDEHGIRAVLPAEEYRLLMAIAEVGGSGAGEGVRTLDPLLGKQMLYH